MDQIVILFVPTGVKEPELETVLRLHLPSLRPMNPGVPQESADLTRRDLEKSQLWTWFIPNPYP